MTRIGKFSFPFELAYDVICKLYILSEHKLLLLVYCRSLSILYLLYIYFIQKNTDIIN